MLLAEPLERTPLRTRGRVAPSTMSAVIFFIAAIGAIAGAIGVVALRNPFYSVLALVGHLLSLAALFLLLRAEFVAAAQVVVYAGAVMVLYVFVVSYVGGGDEPLDARRARPARASPAVAVARAVRRAGDRDARLRPEGDRRRRRAATCRGFGSPAADRRAAADEVPAAVRGRLAPAARRGGRRGRARAPAPRRRRSATSRATRRATSRRARCSPARWPRPSARSGPDAEPPAASDGRVRAEVA